MPMVSYTAKYAVIKMPEFEVLITQDKATIGV
jgi:hypothetical protein